MTAPAPRHRHIRLQACIPCSGPDELTDAQRAAMVAYKDAEDCQRDYQRALEACEPDEIDDYYPTRKAPHAVVELDIRGYAVRHNPNEYWYYIQCCSDDDRCRAVDALGDDHPWIMTRYGKTNTYDLVRGFE